MARVSEYVCPSPHFSEGNMACRACGLEHSPLMRCEVAARIAVPNVVPNAEVARSAAWKKAHPEEYRRYQREYMRARRARLPS
jgi:hypothetical protein